MQIAQRLCVGGPLDGRVASSAPETVMLRQEGWNGLYILQRLSPGTVVFKFVPNQPKIDHFAKRKRTMSFAKRLTSAAF